MSRFVVVFAITLLATGAAQAEVRIDSSAARATLIALGRDDLTQSEALQVADLPGNTAMIAKTNELGDHATREIFANELVVAAHGETTRNRFHFDAVRNKRAITRLTEVQ